MELRKEVQMNKLITLITLACLSLTIMGQNETGYTFVYQAEREIEPVFRIAEKPIILDTVMPIPQVSYPLLPIQKQHSFDLEQIQPAKVKLVDKLPQLYNSYVKLGFGNYTMPLGEVFVNSTRSRKYHWGVSAKHLSSWGRINGYAPSQFDRTRIDAYGKMIEDDYTITAKINYFNQGLHFYGIENEEVPGDSIRQRFNNTGVYAQYASHKKDSNTVNYKIGLEYNNYFDRKRADTLDKWNARENYLGLYSNFDYKLRQEVYAADFNVRYNSYKYGIEDSTLMGLDSGFVDNNVLVNIRPNITTIGKNGKWSVNVGVDLVLDAREKTKFIAVPLAKFQYSFFNDILIPYVGLNGGVRQNTFKLVSQENPFVSSNLELRNEYNALNLHGGIKGVLSKKISFDANISFGKFTNRLLFVIDTTYSGGNRFTAVYDTMNITRIEGSISYQANEKLKIDLIGQYFSYMTKFYPYAWNLPDYVITLRGHYNLFDKFYVNLDFTLLGGRKGLEYGPGENIAQEEIYYYSKLGIIADANLGVEYRYNKRISAFVQFNNFAAQQYQRWQRYPVQQFQVLGGITFRF